MIEYVLVCCVWVGLMCIGAVVGAMVVELMHG